MLEWVEWVDSDRGSKKRVEAVMRFGAGEYPHFSSPNRFALAPGRHGNFSSSRASRRLAHAFLPTIDSRKRARFPASFSTPPKVLTTLSRFSCVLCSRTRREPFIYFPPSSTVKTLFQILPPKRKASSFYGIAYVLNYFPVCMCPRISTNSSLTV